MGTLGIVLLILMSVIIFVSLVKKSFQKSNPNSQALPREEANARPVSAAGGTAPGVIAAITSAVNEYQKSEKKQ